MKKGLMQTTDKNGTAADESLHASLLDNPDADLEFRREALEDAIALGIPREVAEVTLGFRQVEAASADDTKPQENLRCAFSSPSENLLQNIHFHHLIDQLNIGAAAASFSFHLDNTVDPCDPMELFFRLHQLRDQLAQDELLKPLAPFAHSRVKNHT